MTAMPVVVSEAEERVSVAPNWLLVWWRFRKNKLALFSSVVLILICIVALFPGFFSTQDPQESTSRLAFIPLQTLHFFDEGGSSLLSMGW
jgi:peptide/nickel transport system permease protein